MTVDNLEHHYNKQPGDKAYIVLHGIREGINSDLMIQLVEKHLQSKPYISFNFPYITSKQEKPSEGLQEEVAALTQVVDFMLAEGYTELHLIGKSLGGVVTSRFLDTYEPSIGAAIIVTVLGYVVGDVDTKAIGPYLETVIQGSEDRFGSAEIVRQELARAGFGDVSIHEVKGGDHSYRSPDGTDKLKHEAVSYITV
jgi:predicted alpha/beta-hydrolase family hydrolase